MAISEFFFTKRLKGAKEVNLYDKHGDFMGKYWHVPPKFNFSTMEYVGITFLWDAKAGCYKELDPLDDDVPF